MISKSLLSLLILITVYIINVESQRLLPERPTFPTFRLCPITTRNLYAPHPTDRCSYLLCRPNIRPTLRWARPQISLPPSRPIRLKCPRNSCVVNLGGGYTPRFVCVRSRRCSRYCPGSSQPFCPQTSRNLFAPHPTDKCRYLLCRPNIRPFLSRRPSPFLLPVSLPCPNNGCVQRPASLRFGKTPVCEVSRFCSQLCSPAERKCSLLSRLSQVPCGFTSQSGNTTHDIGLCAGRCFTDRKTCCQPTSYTLIDYLVSDTDPSIRVPVARIAKCACLPCKGRLVTVTGFVTSEPRSGSVGTNGAPLASVSVSAEGARSTLTNELGFYSLLIRTDATRLVLRFIPRSAAQHIRSVKVVEADGVAPNVRLDVRLLFTGAAVSFNSITGGSVTMAAAIDNAPPLAELQFRPNTFVRADGSFYNGEVRAAYRTIDPLRLNDSVIDSVGDFSADGGRAQLRTFGMFYVTLTDENGDLLSMRGRARIRISAERIGGFADVSGRSPVQMFGLNERDGRWVEESDLRSEASIMSGVASRRVRRQAEPAFFIGDIPVGLNWKNIDRLLSLFGDQLCYAHVRAYSSTAFSPAEQQTNVRVTVVALNPPIDDSLPAGWASARIGYTWTNGACLLTFCSNSTVTNNTRGLVYASRDGIPYRPADPDQGHDTGLSAGEVSALNYSVDAETLYVDFVRSTDGVFYAADGFTTACNTAEVTEKHLRFYSPFNGTCPLEYDPVRLAQADADEQTNMRAFYPDAAGPASPRFRVCYLKVRLERQNCTRSFNSSGSFLECDQLEPVGDGVPVRAASFNQSGGPVFGEESLGNYMFGLRDECTEFGAVCLEVKRSGEDHSSDDVIDGIPNARGIPFLQASNLTEVRLSVESSQFLDELRNDTGLNGQVYLEGALQFNPELTQDFGDVLGAAGIKSGATRFSLPDSDFGPEYGIYCEEGDELDSLKASARHKCRGGSGIEAEEMNPDQGVGLGYLLRRIVINRS